MKNVIKIFQPVISERTIKYVYEISGEWSEAFNLSENFLLNIAVIFQIYRLELQ